MEQKTKLKENLFIVEYRFNSGGVHNVSKIKHPSNINGTRKDTKEIKLKT